MSNRITFFISLFIAACSFSSFRCYGFSSAVFTFQDTLKEVKVRSTKIIVKSNSPTPVQVLDADDLEKINSLSVADAVRHFSGVQLKDYGGIGGLKTINVRSLGSNHSGVFYEGIRLGNAQNGQIDLSKFSLDNIEAIELFNGQKNISLQPASAFASASSLYLRSKQADFHQNQKSSVKAAFKTGSFGLVNPTVLWQQKISKNLSSSFSAELLEATGKYRFRYVNGSLDSLVTRSNADISAKRVEAGLNKRFADSSEWTVKVYSYWSERGLPSAVLTNRLNSSQKLWDTDVFVQSSYKSSLSKRFKTLFNAKYGYNYSRYLDPEYLNIDNKLDNRYKQRELYLSSANEYSLTPFLDISLAADYIRNSMDANLYDFAYPTRNTGLIALSSSLHLNRFNMQAGLLNTLVHETVKTGNASSDKKVLSPFVSASWQAFASSDLYLRAFYKEIFRLPTFNDLYYTFSGNIDLRPEYATQYDLGFTYSKTISGTLQYFSVRGDAYYNRVKDKIVAIPTANLFRWSMVNLGLVDIYGLELNFDTEWKLSNNLNLNTKVNYTYQKALDKTPGSLNYNQFVPYTPEHTGTAFFNLNWKSYNLNYNFTYTGDRYSLRANIPANYMEPWYTHDVSVGRSFNTGKARFKVLGEVNNLFEQSYEVVRNFPMPGRSYRLTVALNY